MARGGKGTREGLGVEAWANSNKNRVSNVTRLCRAGALIMTHFHFWTKSDWTLSFMTPISVVQRQIAITEKRKRINCSNITNTVFSKKQIWQLRTLTVGHTKRSDQVYHGDPCTHTNHVLMHEYTQTQEHQCTSRVRLTAATGTEVQDNHLCFLFFWK